MVAVCWALGDRLDSGGCAFRGLKFAPGARLLGEMVQSGRGFGARYHRMGAFAERGNDESDRDQRTGKLHGLQEGQVAGT